MDDELRVDAPQQPAFEVKDGVLVAVKNLGDATTVELPPQIKAIGAYAFPPCKIERLCLPKSVVRIHEGAFRNCARLAHVELWNTVMRIDQDAFPNIDALCVHRICGYYVRARTEAVQDSMEPLFSWKYMDCSALALSETEQQKLLELASALFAQDEGLATPEAKLNAMKSIYQYCKRFKKEALERVLSHDAAVKSAPGSLHILYNSTQRPVTTCLDGGVYGGGTERSTYWLNIQSLSIEKYEELYSLCTEPCGLQGVGIAKSGFFSANDDCFTRPNLYFFRPFGTDRCLSIGYQTSIRTRETD